MPNVNILWATYEIISSNLGFPYSWAVLLPRSPIQSLLDLMALNLQVITVTCQKA